MDQNNLPAVVGDLPDRNTHKPEDAKPIPRGQKLPPHIKAYCAYLLGHFVAHPTIKDDVARRWGIQIPNSNYFKGIEKGTVDAAIVDVFLKARNEWSKQIDLEPLASGRERLRRREEIYQKAMKPRPVRSLEGVIEVEEGGKKVQKEVKQIVYERDLNAANKTLDGAIRDAGQEVIRSDRHVHLHDSDKVKQAREKLQGLSEEERRVAKEQLEKDVGR